MGVYYLYSKYNTINYLYIYTLLFVFWHLSFKLYCFLKESLCTFLYLYLGEVSFINFTLSSMFIISTTRLELFFICVQLYL